MKRSTEVILVAAFLLAAVIVPSLKANDAARPAAHPAPLPPELALTDEQKSTLKSLRTGHHDAVGALRADTALSPEEKRTQARALRKDHAGQVRSVLSAEQQAALREHRANRPHGPRGGGDRPPRQRQPRG